MIRAESLDQQLFLMRILQKLDKNSLTPEQITKLEGQPGFSWDSNQDLSEDEKEYLVNLTQYELNEEESNEPEE